jgi:hypothetical protein
MFSLALQAGPTNQLEMANEVNETHLPTMLVSGTELPKLLEYPGW